jgi:gas vesicle protein
MARRNSGTFWKVIMGGVIGASVALLYAPQTGEKTRKKLVKYGKQATNRTQRFVGEISESLDDVLQEVLQYTEEGMKHGKNLSSKARSEMLDILDAGRKYIEEERNKLEKVFK